MPDDEDYDYCDDLGDEPEDDADDARDQWADDYRQRVRDFQP